jgi:serine/threonine-protein kinase
VASEETGATGAATGASSGEDERSGALGLTGKLLAGRYRVQSRLGAGGMATVYRAKDESPLDRQVVVKVPHAALLVDPGFRKRFAKEINSLSKLEHPNIIPIYDVGEDDGVPFAVTKFLGGGDLSDRVEAAGGQISPERIAEWLPRIAETLDFVHSRGYLHRDVSPGNIIFDDLGNAHLSDFGIATAVRSDDPDETARDLSNLTRPGGFVGAATYAPPESIERKLNPAYDQYSLAVVVYEALCGQVPFERASSEAMLVAKNTQPPAPLDEKISGLPAGLVAAVMRALSKEPAKRFESSRAFAEAFQRGITAADAAVAEERPANPGTVVVDVSAHERERRDVPWLALGTGIGVLALAGAGLWFLLGGLATQDGTGTESGLAALPSASNATASQLAAGGGIEVTIGSTAAEQQAAYELCQQVLGSGCNPEDYADEVMRSESIGPIEIDAEEVTNREFAAFASGGRHRTIAERQGYSYLPVSGGLLAKGTNLSWRAPTVDSGYRDRLDHPVVHVSQADATAYCQAQGKRLPSEAEWEYGARGPTRTTFPWGDEWSDDLSEKRASWNLEATRPVGSAPEGASWTGLQDMAGSVWEWTSTSAPGDSGEIFLKGGSWSDRDPARLRGAMHMMATPGDTSGDIGFRCVRDL